MSYEVIYKLLRWKSNICNNKKHILRKYQIHIFKIILTLNLVQIGTKQCFPSNFHAFSPKKILRPLFTSGDHFNSLPPLLFLGCKILENQFEIFSGTNKYFAITLDCLSECCEWMNERTNLSRKKTSTLVTINSEQN